MGRGIGFSTVFLVWGYLSAGGATAESWRQETLLDGLPVHGVHGLTFGPDGRLYVGSVMGQTVIAVNVNTGAVEDVIAAPHGEADDVAFGPGGQLAWTALNAGELRLRDQAGAIKTVAANLNFVNPVTFGPDGILYAATLFGPDRLWAYDLNSGTSRIIAENLGGLNAFEFGPDGLLYTPLPQQQAVGKIDVNTGTLTVIAEDVGNIVAVKFHPDGLLYGVSWDDGTISRIDPKTGWSETVAVVPPPLDNLAIDEGGTIYVSRSADNGIVAVDPVSGSSRIMMRSNLAAPGGMAWIERDGKTQLLITDIFGYRFVDPKTSETTLLPFDLANGASADVDVRDKLIALSYVRRNRVLLKDSVSGDVIQSWTDIATPYGLLISNSGSVLTVSHTDGTLVRLSLEDSDQRTVIISNLDGPVGLAWAEQDQAVYVAEAVAGQITHINLETGTRIPVVTGLVQPEGIAVHPDGRLIVAEVGARRVVAVHPETADISVLAQDLAVGGLISRAPVPVGMPTGIAVDKHGAIYIVTDANNGLLKLTTD